MSKRPRPPYKKLYEELKEQSAQLEWEKKVLKKRLEEIRDALVVYGEKELETIREIIEQAESKGENMALFHMETKEHEWIAVREALMMKGPRFGSEARIDPINIRYFGVPLVRVK